MLTSSEVDFYASAFPATEGNALVPSLTSNKRMAEWPGRFNYHGRSQRSWSYDGGPIGIRRLLSPQPAGPTCNFYFGRLIYLSCPFIRTFRLKWSTKSTGKMKFISSVLGAIDDFELNLDANKTEQQQFLLQVLPVQTQWNYTSGLVYKHYGKQGLFDVCPFPQHAG